VKGSFDCFLGVDWSGNKERWQKGLKVAIAFPGTSPPRLKQGRGPNGFWSRNEFSAWLCGFVQKKRALIGIDFAFAFPTVAELDAGVVLDWDYVEGLCAAELNFYGGPFFRMENATHSNLVNSPWRRPGQHYSAHRLRPTELAAKRLPGATPQSVFNARGPAQVGPSSISGMRMLRHLRLKYQDTFSIWPVDALDDGRSVIVEIFPRYFTLSKGLSPKVKEIGFLNAALKEFCSEPIAAPPKSEDEGDALLSAAALRKLSERRELFCVPNTYDRSHGWIFGVPFGADA
jgi:hypothetical protein